MNESSDEQATSAALDSRGVSRRGLIAGTCGAVALFAVGGLKFAPQNSICRPPGGQDASVLVGACIRCERCYEACPRGVVYPAKIEDGILGMRTPALDFDRSNYCDFCYEENGGHPKCVSVCPTGALSLDSGVAVGNPQTKTRGDVILGLAEIDTTTCLAYRMAGCLACYDACPYGAIELAREGSANPLPEVVTQKCNGCGACQAACLSLSSGSIQSDTKAIVVKPIA